MVTRVFAKPDAERPRGLRKKAAPHKKSFSRELRKNPTISERLLWDRLRRRQCAGLRFRRQAIVLGWITDFWCPSVRLVVEVDGKYHLNQVAGDQRRDEVMAGAGISVLRLPVALVESYPEKAISEILSFVEHISVQSNRIF
jgi:very-short-patch-repair endonuclease